VAFTVFSHTLPLFNRVHNFQTLFTVFDLLTSITSTDNCISSTFYCFRSYHDKKLNRLYRKQVKEVVSSHNGKWQIANTKDKIDVSCQVRNGFSASCLQWRRKLEISGEGPAEIRKCALISTDWVLLQH